MDFRNFTPLVFAHQNTWIPTRDTSAYIYCYNYIWIRFILISRNQNFRLEKPASRIAFLFFFYTLRTIDVFTDAGIGSHSLHFINLGGISSPLYIRPASRSRYRARGCGIRSKIRGGVFRIRDFFHPVRHPQTCGNKLKSESGKFRIWGFRVCRDFARYVFTFTKMCHVWSSVYRPLPVLEYFDKCRYR